MGRTRESLQCTRTRSRRSGEITTDVPFKISVDVLCVTSSKLNIYSHRGKNRRGKMAYGGSSSSTEMDNQPSGPVIDAGDPNDVSGSSKGAESESEAAVSPQKLAKCIEPTKVSDSSLFSFW